RASRAICQDFAAFDLPLLMLHGTGDVITGIVGCEQMLASAPSADKTLIRYDGAYHDLFHELPSTREKVLADLISWLESHLE
ncbi:MAG: alpha/beta hydrolase, partial [Planctomycetia bacterium]|nr:alpha/beta hydrolase [Planctomycetia bacterium]